MRPQRSSGVDLTEVTVVATSCCNQRCSYCCATRRPGSYVPWPAVGSSLDHLLASPANRVRIAFTGGEPLLARPLIERAVSYVEARRRPAQTVRYKLMTNGLLLDRRTCAWLERHAFDLQVSLDGTREAQEARSPGTFDAVDGALQGLRRRSPSYFRTRVTVAMTLTPQTVSHLADSVSHLIGIGVATIAINPAMDAQPVRRGWLPELNRQFGEVYRRSLAHYWHTGNVPVRLFRKSPFGNRRHPTGWACQAPLGRSVVVDADGEVSTCLLATRTYTDGRPLTPAMRAAARSLRAGPADQDLPNRLRQVRDHAARAGIFAADAHRHAARGPCSQCEWREQCVVCPLMAAGVSGGHGSFRVPDFLCAFNRLSALYRDRFPVTPPGP